MKTLPDPTPICKSPTHHALNAVIGDDELCAWQPVAGVTWVQYRTPEHANRLAKRKDSRLVVRGMVGGYLKIFEFQHSLSWATQLIRRYARKDHSANSGINGLSRPAGTFSSEASLSTADTNP